MVTTPLGVEKPCYHCGGTGDNQPLGSRPVGLVVPLCPVCEGRGYLLVATPRFVAPRLVILESPYAGDVEANVAYARACLLDSLQRGEAPIASHLLYTQVLDDTVPEERAQGIAAGLAWRSVPGVLPAFYIDRGWSGGMLAARDMYDRENVAYEFRRLPTFR